MLSGQGDGPSIVTDEDSDTADALALMAEMRRIRGQQARLADQLGVVEKRLRAILG